MVIVGQGVARLGTDVTEGVRQLLVQRLPKGSADLQVHVFGAYWVWGTIGFVCIRMIRD